MQLKGKNILITGAAKRLGSQMAVALAERGANIVIHYHTSGDEANCLVDKLVSMGVKAAAIKADIEKPKEITRTVIRASEILRGLDVLINNAAIFFPTHIDSVSDKEWNQFMDVNLKAQFYFARTFASLRYSSPAKIINMSDTYGMAPAIDYIPYGVSKAGVIALTKGLAKAYAPDILVNCICPGLTQASEFTNKESEARAIKRTLLKKMINPEDIVRTVIFLAENDSVTGNIFFIDGGRNI